MDAVKNVCILGGTHGNEMSGIFLLKKLQKNQGLIQRSSFVTKTVLSNPEAVKLTRRYVDHDLNRSFTKDNFEANITPETSYEVQRVNKLKAMMSEGGELGPCQFLIDLHNTTANMKMCLINLDLSDFVLHMLNYVTSKFPDNTCNNLYYPGLQSDSTVLATQGIGLEVGPQPHGVLREDIMNLHEEAVVHCLDYIESFNSGTVFDETSITIHEVEEYVKFPRDSDGNMKAVIHSSLQDRDWSPVTSTDPVFTLFDGTVLLLRDVAKFEMKQNEVLYPCFINEAAYYEKDVAFLLCTKRQVSVPKLQRR